MKILWHAFVDGFKEGWELYWSPLRGPRHMATVFKKHLNRIKGRL
jgi:hypothetical protein